MTTSLIYAGIEYLNAIIMIVFFFTIGLVAKTQIPSWFPLNVDLISPVKLWIVLLIVGIIRAFCSLISKQTGHAVLELVRARLKMIQGYKMLITDQQHSFSMSRLNMIMGEFIPHSADFIFHATEMFLILLQIIIISAGLFYLSWQETLIGIGCLLIAGIVISRMKKNISKISKKIPEERNRLENALVRICNNLLIIKILHIRDREYENYLNSVFNYYRYSIKFFFFWNASVVIPPLTGIIILAIIIHTNYVYFNMPAVELVTFIYLFTRFTQITVLLSENLGFINRYQVHFRESVKLFNSLSEEQRQEACSQEKTLSYYKKIQKKMDIEFYKTKINKEWNKIYETIPPDINIKNITYTWPGTLRPVFKNFSMYIESGSKLGIIGPNGSGKSTLVGLILGILKPSSGEIRIGEFQCSEYVQSSHSIGYVGAEPYLIYGTIRENLSYGNPRNISAEEIMDVLKIVNLEKTITDLPSGLDHIIQENGEGLSLGEKQLLSLARAFLRNPSLLFLDEASANLERNTENKIADVLDKFRGKCTMLIVSHKPGILKGISQILDLGKNHETKNQQ